MQPMMFRHGILVTVADEPRMLVGPGWVKRVMFDFILPSWLIRGAYHGREDIIREVERKEGKNGKV